MARRGRPLGSTKPDAKVAVKLRMDPDYAGTRIGAPVRGRCPASNVPGCVSSSRMRYEGMCLDWLNKVSHSSGGLPRSSIF